MAATGLPDQPIKAGISVADSGTGLALALSIFAALLQGEGEVPDFYANTAQDVEMLREVVALADRRYLPDQSVICQIIGEEISGYNADILTAQQTAERIQNRVQLYLDEWK